MEEIRKSLNMGRAATFENQKLSIVNLSVLSKLMYRFIAIPIKISHVLYLINLVLLLFMHMCAQLCE